MNKYIDADRLRVEIEKRIENYNASIENKEESIKAERDSWKWAECKWFLNLITSLQQEQPEVDLAELNWGDIESICQMILDTNRLVRERMAPDDALHYATTKEYYQEILNRFYQTRK